jgi:hypothetical protein
MSLWTILIIRLDSFKSFVFVEVTQYFIRGKGKGKGQIELQSIRNLGARNGWMVSTNQTPAGLPPGKKKYPMYRRVVGGRSGRALKISFHRYRQSFCDRTILYVIRISVFKL